MAVRTLVEAQNEIVYAVLLWSRASRYFGRVRMLLSVLQIAGGSAAMGLALGPTPQSRAAVAAGLVVMLAGVIDQVIDPAVKSARYAERYRSYVRFQAEIGGTTDLATVDKQLWTMRADDPVVSDGLRSIAHHDMLRTLGYEPSKLSFGQRLLACLA